MKKHCIRRPKGSKDKTIRHGMRIVAMPDGDMQARHRVGKGQTIVGYVIGNKSIDIGNGTIEFTDESEEQQYREW